MAAGLGFGTNTWIPTVGSCLHGLTGLQELWAAMGAIHREQTVGFGFCFFLLSSLKPSGSTGSSLVAGACCRHWKAASSQMHTQLRCCYTGSATWHCQLYPATLLFACLLVCLFALKGEGNSLLHFVAVIWFVLAFRVLLRQAEWKFQLHAFICSPLACRLREQGYGPIGLHVINLLGTMRREHLNVSWLFRQALSEGLLIYRARITKQ